MKTGLIKFACCLILGVFLASGLVLPNASSTSTGLLGQSLVGFVGASPANAQQKPPKIRNLFQLLFDRKRKSSPKSNVSKPQVQKRPTSRKSTTRKRSVSRQNNTARAAATGGTAAAAAAAATVASKPKIVEKNQDAAKVLVVGDFVGDRMANGLTVRFESDPNVVFLDESRGNSGLVREDVYNWPEKLGELIDENKPKLVIMAIGMNDRQQMRVDGSNVDKLTDQWKQEYEKRVDEVISKAKQQNIPLIWVGLPPVRVPSMNADYLLLNEIYRNKTEASGNKYIDIWDGFTDADGNFVTAGPDVSGQIVRLRLNDGINFTKAGRDKLAFYVERPVRSIIGLGAPEIASTPIAGQLPNSTFNSDAAKTGRTALMSLNGASIDGGDQLDGTGSFVDHSEEALSSSTSYDLVVKGISTKPHAGRIDADWGNATDQATEKPKDDAPSKDSSTLKSPESEGQTQGETKG